jgi:hypothetical protein
MEPDDFKRKMLEIGNKDIPELVVLVQKKLVFEALRKIILKSPVDTGLFRANWQIGVEVPSRDTSEGTANDAERRANAVLASLRPYQTVWLSNNLAYAEGLEHGNSKQAPLGVVAVTVQEIEEWIKRQNFKL